MILDEEQTERIRTMYEIEIKVPLKDAKETAEKLTGLGFTILHRIREEDIYFDTAASQIKNNGEALRVRTVTDQDSGKEESVITFKGKRMDTVSKSRKELETGVSERDTVIEILESIGFHKVVPRVVKTRSEYSMGRMNACLDHIESLGDFLELEIVVHGESEKDAALAEITEVLQRLGYSLEDTVRNSYLSMLQGVSDV